MRVTEWLKLLLLYHDVWNEWMNCQIIVENKLTLLSYEYLMMVYNEFFVIFKNDEWIWQWEEYHEC